MRKVFVLDRHGDEPLFLQLYGQLKERILAGGLVKGSRLKSVRALAREYNIGRNTVETAYQQLVAEGYVEGKPGSGYYVTALDMSFTPPAEPAADGRGFVDAADEEGGIDFDPARLSPAIFPHKIWRKLAGECLREKDDLAGYRDARGESGLRREIHKYLAASRGVVCDPEQVVICAGTANALSGVCQLLRPTHAAMAVEEPGYYTARAVFANHAFEIVPITVRPDGIDAGELASSGSRAVYVTPSHQFPLGYVMPIANRFKLLQWARETDAVIIEDDYDSELSYYGQPIPALQGLDPGGQIIYLGTFSKSLSPALRVSYMVLPWRLLAKYKETFRYYQSSVPLLTQSALAAFMAGGHWERHLRKVRATYRMKHDAVLRALAGVFGGRVTVISSGAGLHIPLAIPGSGGDDELVKAAGKAGVKVYPLSVCSARGAARLGIRLGFGGVADEDIEKGIGLLRTAWFG